MKIGSLLHTVLASGVTQLILTGQLQKTAGPTADSRALDRQSGRLGGEGRSDDDDGGRRGGGEGG